MERVELFKKGDKKYFLSYVSLILLNFKIFNK